MDTIQTQAAYIRLNTLEKTKGTTKNGHSTDTDSLIFALFFSDVYLCIQSTVCCLCLWSVNS
jgi:hypothetical protein